MIQEKTKKTRRRVKKVHKKAVETGLLGSTAPVGGGAFTLYFIEYIRNGSIVKQDVVAEFSLPSILKYMDDSPDYDKILIQKTDGFGKQSIGTYEFKFVRESLLR
jgi:hypothetical protein